MAYASITKPSLHFNTKLYTGNGGTQSITGVGFQPDWVWLKKRNSTADHGLYDAVRGVTKQLYSNDTAVEATNANSLTAFGTDGFSIGTSSMINGNSDTFASWNWKANGAGSSNTAGDINSTVSVNTTAGFSIVSYTGSGSVATIGHGLGVAPELIIVKRLSGNTEAWPVDSRKAGGILYLNETGAKGSYGNSSPFPADSPTSTLFYVGSANNANASGAPFIAYCFTSIKGFSKTGTYAGNGNDDGPFIYTGFKPAFIIIKSHIGTDNWIIYDSKRNGTNSQNARLYANTNSGEDLTAGQIDLYSNGFRPTSDYSSINYNNGNYVYYAFAEEPLVANVGEGIPATAR